MFLKKSKKESDRSEKIFLCFCLVLTMALSAVGTRALDDLPEADFCFPGPVDPDKKIILDCDTELIEALAGAIGAVGSEEAFRGILDRPEDYCLLYLCEITQNSGTDEDGFTLRLYAPGVRNGDEIAMLLGTVKASNVQWSFMDVLSLEDELITVFVNAEQAETIRSDSAVLAILVR